MLELPFTPSARVVLAVPTRHAEDIVLAGDWGTGAGIARARRVIMFCSFPATPSQ